MEPIIKTTVQRDAEREAVNGASKMSLHDVDKRINQLLAEHLKCKAMGLEKDAEVKGALAAAYARVWLRRQ